MKRVYLHTLPIRIWHWANAAIILVLTVTGAYLRSPDALPLLRYSDAVSIHKRAGFAMAVLFLLWFVYSAFSGNLRRNYLIRKEDMRNLPRQGIYYALGIFRGAANPFEPSTEQKFNAMQKLAYLSVMAVLTPVIVVTGVLFSDITLFMKAIYSLGGVRVLDALHVAAAYVFLIYLIVHLYMATLGHSPTAHTKAMFTGYEEEPDEAP